MPFIAHTEQEIQEMLRTIGVPSIQDLFDEIPQEIYPRSALHIDPGMSEKNLTKLLTERAGKDRIARSFIGAGAYEHFIPSTVWALASRGEFMTAYTPYQAEASQGSLQLIYEYQSMMTELMALDLSNASLYDGASALSEAILMAIRMNKKSKTRHILMIGPLAPWVIDTVQNITIQQNITIDVVDYPLFQKEKAHYATIDYAAIVISQPNFFGQIVDTDALTDWAHDHHQVVIAYVNPMAMSLLKPPGEWGKTGADIACGEGQPLGIPLSFGGPYFGFLCCKLEDARQMPGRIVGKTKDREGRVAFCLTLQAREQHIRRAKATSNICTNQGLMVTAATIYMTLMGAEGLYRVAEESHHNAQNLAKKLCQIPGVSLAVPGPFYCEFSLKLPVQADIFLKQMEDIHQIQAGLSLSSYGDDMSNVILVCTTEIHDAADHEAYIHACHNVLSLLTSKGA